MKLTIGLGVLFLTLTACKDEVPTETADTGDTDTPSDPGVPTDTDLPPTDTDEPSDSYACGEGGSPEPPETAGLLPGTVPSHITRVDLGVHLTDCGFSEPLSLEIPAGTTSFMLGLVGAPGTFVLPGRVLAPDGTEITRFDPVFPEEEAAALGLFASVMLNSSNPGATVGATGGLVVPNNAGPVESLNVYFVERFEIPGAPGAVDGLLGLSRGLPGLPFARQGGVVMATAPLVDNPDLGAHVMAHEIGHFLGLRHTEESTGLHHDPLDDTPEGLTNNLMFFEAGLFPLDELTLSPEQGRVLRRHPLVYPAP